MTKIQIKTSLGSIFFEHESQGNSVKETVKELLKAKKGQWIEQVDLSNYDLSGIDFSNSQFYNSQFDNSKFYNSQFYNSKFDNSQFDNSQFYNSKFDNSQFYNSKFYNSKFYNSKFDNSQFDNSQFDNSQFYNSKFYNSKFDNSQFYNSKFYNSKFDEVSFSNLKNSGALEPIRCDFFGRLLILKSEVGYLKTALQKGRVNGSAYEGECSCFMGTIANAKKCTYKQLVGLKPDSSSDTERWFFSIKKGDTPDNSLFVKQTIEWIEEFEMYLNDTAN